jgi:hypothetical protein
MRIALSILQLVAVAGWVIANYRLSNRKGGGRRSSGLAPAIDPDRPWTSLGLAWCFALGAIFWVGERLFVRHQQGPFGPMGTAELVCKLGVILVFGVGIGLALRETRIADLRTPQEVQKAKRFEGIPRIAGDLRGNIAIAVAFAVVTPFLAYRWGPSLVKLIGQARGTRDRLFDTIFPVAFGPVLAVMLAAVFGAMAVHLLVLYRKSQAYYTVERAANHLGVTPEHVQDSITARSVKPRFIRNGVPIYALSDLT